jgi:hypothetical protein
MRMTDKKRIEALEIALRIIATWADCDHLSIQARDKAMNDIFNHCMKALRVNTDCKPKKRNEN